jgi:hypothetical protein
MLTAHTTKRGSGVTLYGDCYDLQSLHETVHYLCEGVPLSPTFREFVLGFAYDVRHAYQGDRNTLAIGVMEDPIVKYHGFPTLWPYFLVDVGLLRWAAGLHSTTRSHQADLFRLEACTQQALLAYDRSIGEKCWEWLVRFGGFPDDYLIDFVCHCTRFYVTETEPGKPRFAALPHVLRTLWPLSDQFQEFREKAEETAKELGCDPRDLTDESEWPEFEW